MKIIPILICFCAAFSALFPIPCWADIDLTGSIRNDAALVGISNTSGFGDIEENKLILSENGDNYRFYADTRVYLFYGGVPAVPSNISLITSNGGISLLRAFARYDAGGIGNFTVGKTYVNLGEPVVFNPFEMVKSVDFNDLSYDKDGMLAFMDEFSINGNSLAGGKVYLSPQNTLSNTAAGGSLYANFWGFDAGAVYDRKTADRNVAGVYFKGDLELGINGSAACHFDDALTDTNNFTEFELGGDYSFFEDKLIFTLDFYYNTGGAPSISAYNPLSTADQYFQGKYYMYGNLSVLPDSYWKLMLYSFYNIGDGSFILIPELSYNLSDGFDISLISGLPFGTGQQEFSSTQFGTYSLLLRTEAKL